MSGGMPSIFGGLFDPPAPLGARAPVDDPKGDLPTSWSPNFPAEFLGALKQAADATAPGGWSAPQWGAVIGGVVSRETAPNGARNAWGSMLRPRGPAGAGDPTPRWSSSPPDGADLTGQERVNADGDREYQYGPPTVLGAKGFGFGLGQVDYYTSGESPEFFERGEWADPAVALTLIGEHLARDYKSLDGDLYGALSAYNHGVSGYRKRLAAAGGIVPPGGLWPNQEGGDYASNALDRARGYGLADDAAGVA